MSNIPSNIPPSKKEIPSTSKEETKAGKVFGKLVSQDEQGKTSARASSEPFKSLAEKGWKREIVKQDDEKPVPRAAKKESSSPEPSIEANKQKLEDLQTKQSQGEQTPVETPLEIKDMFTVITGHLKKADKKADSSKLLKMREINKRSEKFTTTSDQLRVVLTPSDLHSNLVTSEKLDFVQKKDLKIKVKMENKQDVQDLIDFIQKPENQATLDRLEGIELGDINYDNAEKIQELLDLLALTTKGNQLRNLSFFTCGNIQFRTTLTFPEELNMLRFFSCGDINGRLTPPQELISFTCRNVQINAILMFPENSNLHFFSCGEINGSLTLPKKLISFTCGEVQINADLMIPEDNSLTSLSFGHVSKPATKQKLEDLQASISAKSKDKTIGG